MPSAERLYQRMVQTRHGWGQKDFRRLYRGFGFDEQAGKKHTLYQHPDYPHLIATVGRHNELSAGYADDAVRIIGELKKLQDEAENEEDDEQEAVDEP